MNLNLIKLTPEQREALFPTQKPRISTLEQLAAWLLFSLAIITVYGLLSMTWAHARDIPPPSEFNWIDTIFAWPEPTFAQMEYSRREAKTGRWVAMFLSNHGFWAPDTSLTFASKKECEEAIQKYKPEVPNTAGDVKCVRYHRGAPGG